MEIESLFGLPAHPLIVHAAVVLVPLSALGTLLCLYPPLRRRLGVAVFVLAVAASFATGLAQGSGEELEHKVDESPLVEEHAEMGTTLLPWVIVMTVTLGGLLALDWQRSRTEGGGEGDTAASAPPAWVKPVVIGASAIMAVTAIGGTVRVIDIGHSGAKATWDDVGSEGGAATGDLPVQDHDDDGD